MRLRLVTLSQAASGRLSIVFCVATDGVGRLEPTAATAASDNAYPRPQAVLGQRRLCGTLNCDLSYATGLALVSVSTWFRTEGNQKTNEAGALIIVVGAFLLGLSIFVSHGK
jgi:hypothetical protein